MCLARVDSSSTFRLSKIGRLRRKFRVSSSDAERFECGMAKIVV